MSSIPANGYKMRKWRRKISFYNKLRKSKNRIIKGIKMNSDIFQSNIHGHVHCNVHVKIFGAHCWSFLDSKRKARAPHYQRFEFRRKTWPNLALPLVAFKRVSDFFDTSLNWHGHRSWAQSSKTLNNILRKMQCAGISAISLSDRKQRLKFTYGTVRIHVSQWAGIYICCSRDTDFTIRSRRILWVSRIPIAASDRTYM